MKLKSTIQLYAASPAGTTAPGTKMLPDDNGMNTVPRDAKKYKVLDSKYGTYISSWDTYEEARKAMMARPYSKIIIGKIPGQYGAGQIRRKFKGDL